MNTEAQIQAEIAQLREQITDTQDLYREVCVVLFFRHGITPSANRLYQYVRKGSMSAPAEALSKFWENLREKSRVRIDHPDLPDNLRLAAGELTATLWTKALAEAQEGFAVFRSEAQAKVVEARALQATAEADRELARGDAAAAKVALAEATETISDLEKKLAGEIATRTAIESHLQGAKREIERLQSDAEKVRGEFSSELEKNRVSAELANERFRAAEERTLLELDRERTLASKVNKELDQIRANAVRAAERHKTETNALHSEVGQLRQKIGILEGNLQAVLSERDRISADTASLQRQVTESAFQAAGYRADAENWRRQAENAQKTVVSLQAKATRRGRKVSDAKST